MDTLLFTFWFFLPAGLANASPVFANKIPMLNRWRTPLDFGRSYRGKRLLGANKTWRGFCFGVIIGALTGGAIYALYPASALMLGFTSSPATQMVLLGTLLGAGALLGDALESFFKRQLGIPSGEAWFPFDQIDYIIGGILLSSLLITLSPFQNVVILLVWFGLHLISSYVGFLVKLKDKPI